MAGLHIFIFKKGSRNNADNGISSQFENNYITLFGLRLPIMDTVNIFLEKLPPQELEKIKQLLVKRLIEKKVLSKYRFNNSYIVAVDGTGVYSFSYEPFPGCPYKTSKKGKKSWQVYVLEAKILCGNGFSISIATEWLQNSDDIDAKQDCELKAFSRLSDKIKKFFPRLPIIIAADSLYPNQTVFEICKSNKWNYILTLRDGTLKTVWEEINLLLPFNRKQNQAEKTLIKDKKGWLCQKSMFLNKIPYKEYELNWIEVTKSYSDNDAIEERFVHVTDILIDKKSVDDVSYYGRLRWKIENEGFNSQKNDGYNLQHKFSHTSLFAMQNYYQLLQIAHLINQLTEKLNSTRIGITESGRTIKSLYEDMISSMLKEVLTIDEINTALNNTRQLRY